MRNSVPVSRGGAAGHTRLGPVGIAVWALRSRTVVDPQTVTVRSLLGRRRVPWNDIASLRLGRKARVSAVLTDGKE